MTLPNQLTVLRILLSPVAVFLLISQEPTAIKIGTAVFLLASFTDWYDGYFARKYGYVTDWGKFMDPLADKILISSMLICFVLMNRISAVWIVIIVARDVVVTALRGYMMMYDKPIAANLLAKWKTFSQVSLVYMLLVVVNIEPLQAQNPTAFSFIDILKFSAFIDKYAQFVAYYTILTGILYLVDNRKPLLELFMRFIRWVTPFNIPSDVNADTGSQQRSVENSREDL